MKPRNGSYADWVGKPFDIEGAVLTPEILEEAAKRAIEQSGRALCHDGHLWTPKEMAAQKGYCSVCGEYLDLTKQ